MKKGKGYVNVKVKANCPPNSLDKMSIPSAGEAITKYSLSKKGVPGGAGINRPEGFGDKL